MTPFPPVFIIDRNGIARPKRPAILWLHRDLLSDPTISLQPIPPGWTPQGGAPAQVPA